VGRAGAVGGGGGGFSCSMFGVLDSLGGAARILPLADAAGTYPTSFLAGAHALLVDEAVYIGVGVNVGVDADVNVDVMLMLM
jgi:hypothetical protein